MTRAGLGFTVLLCLGVCTQALAQPADGAEKVVRLMRSDAQPVIDGVLNEDIWNQAPEVEGLLQVDPIEFAAPSEATQIWIFYGEDTLYVAARLWHEDPNDITAQVLRQGEGLGSDDRFVVILDPYLDRRSGYRFQVNPNGVRWDAIYQDTSRMESNWEGIWQGAATRDESGWTAEMAIPFKTLSFNPNSTAWGINFARIIQAKDETIAWVSRNRQYNPGIAGTATNISGLEQGLGLDIVPSVSLREEQTYGAGGANNSDLEPSLDVFYKITPSLNGSLTLNTDFSATEVDDRQVNLTRFNLFFPEKRDFFLQDADIFEFGRIGGGGFGGGDGEGGGGGGGNPAIPGAARQNGRPFFSRNIGLDAAGQPVDINYGGKLSGRVGRWNLGALAIRQDETQTVDATDIFVGRVTANVLEESAVGVIMTDGDPKSNLDSSLIGTDFRYRNTRLPGGRILEGQAWYQETDTQGLDGQNRAFGAGFNMPNSTGFRGGYRMQQLEENFDPALGFANRTGIRDYALDFGYRHRFGDAWLRSIYGGIDTYQVERLDTGEVESEILSLRVTMNNNVGDQFFNRLVSSKELLLEDFTIYSSSDGGYEVVIPAGLYEFDYFFTGGRTGEQRKLSAEYRFSTGEFYDGDREQRGVGLTWRPSEKVSFRLDYEIEDIELPQGDFQVRLSQLQFQYVFSSTLSWANLIQYDNVSENLGINVRLHWIPQAGREGFIVLNHSLTDADKNDSFHSTNADVSVKFSYTWRF